MERFGHTQEKLAESLGKSRSHIANLIRLLSLPEEVQTYLREGALTYGHARALITSENAAALARQVVAKGLSVRETEALVRKPAATGAKPRSHTSTEKDADTRALEADLSANLGIGVSIDHEPGGSGGRLVLRYRSLEQLDALCRVLSASSMDESL
jgi:ParB family chromosome partitioning protein